MKLTSKLNLLNNAISAALVSILSVIYIPNTWAGDSSSVGDNVRNGRTSTFSVSCKSDERMTGIEIDRLSGLDETYMRLSCAHYGANGEWGERGQTKSKWITNGTSLGSSGITFLCPRNTWVGAVSAIPDFKYGGIELHCYRGTVDGKRTGNQTVPVAGRVRGVATRANCPNEEIAYAVRGQRWVTNDIGGTPAAPSIINFRLRCKAIGAPLAPPGIAPVLVSPGSRASRQVYPGVTEFHLQHVNNATHYRVRILTDSPSPRSWYDQVLGGALLSSSRGNDRYVKIRIPTNKAGTVARWKAAACNRERRCGPWSAWKTFSILPRPR